MASISFEKDIKPTLARSLYRDAMAWRLDLASYEDVKLNAAIIYGQITQGPMPPPPYDPFPQEFHDKFKAWMDGGSAALNASSMRRPIRDRARRNRGSVNP